MTKANALDAVCDLVDVARDERAEWIVWKPEDGTSGFRYREVARQGVGSEEGYLYIRYVPGIDGILIRSGAVLTVGQELQARTPWPDLETVGDERPTYSLLLVLTDRRLKPRLAEERLSSSELGEGAKEVWQDIAEQDAPNREGRNRIRSNLRKLGIPWSEVPLIRHDPAQLEALVALRCLQQGFAAEPAYRKLVDYVKSVCYSGEEDTTAFRVAQELEHRFIDPVPDGLPSYVRQLWKYATLEKRDRDAPHREDRHLLTPRQAAKRLDVSRRTIYRWIQNGKISPAQEHPYRVARSEIKKLSEPGDVGALYEVVKIIRGVGYDAARMWVQRRKKKGMTRPEILQELQETYQELNSVPLG